MWEQKGSTVSPLGAFSVVLSRSSGVARTTARLLRTLLAAAPPPHFMIRRKPKLPSDPFDERHLAATNDEQDDAEHHGHRSEQGDRGRVAASRGERRARSRRERGGLLLDDGRRDLAVEPSGLGLAEDGDVSDGAHERMYVHLEGDIDATVRRNNDELVGLVVVELDIDRQLDFVVVPDGESPAVELDEDRRLRGSRGWCRRGGLRGRHRGAGRRRQRRAGRRRHRGAGRRARRRRCRLAQAEVDLDDRLLGVVDEPRPGVVPEPDTESDHLVPGLILEETLDPDGVVTVVHCLWDISVARIVGVVAPLEGDVAVTDESLDIDVDGGRPIGRAGRVRRPTLEGRHTRRVAGHERTIRTTAVCCPGILDLEQRRALLGIDVQIRPCGLDLPTTAREGLVDRPDDTGGGRRRDGDRVVAVGEPGEGRACALAGLLVPGAVVLRQRTGGGNVGNADRRSHDACRGGQAHQHGLEVHDALPFSGKRTGFGWVNSCSKLPHVYETRTYLVRKTEL